MMALRSSWLVLCGVQLAASLHVQPVKHVCNTPRCASPVCQEGPPVYETEYTGGKKGAPAQKC